MLSGLGRYGAEFVAFSKRVLSLIVIFSKSSRETTDFEGSPIPY